VYDQDLSFYSLGQETFSNLQWYECFNTKVDVGDAIGVTHQHKVLLQQSGNQHGNLKVDLQNDFTTGSNRYPKNRHPSLHLLDKYSKTDITKVAHYEGTSFAKRSGRGGGCGRRGGYRKIHNNLDKEY
jgi:hypothetical protein